MKIKIALFLCTLAVITGCSKENLAKLADNVTISGITARDNNGTLVGPEDTTDWRSENDMPAAVVNLLNFADTLDYSFGDSLSGSVTMVAYPNPFDSIMTINCVSTGNMVMKYAIVDDSLNTYGKNTIKLMTGNSSFTLNLSDPSFKSGKLYRVYYSFIDRNKNILSKGHGDIQKK